MTLYAKEWAAGIIDLFEDFLDEKGVVVPNAERDAEMKADAEKEGCEYFPKDGAAFYGEDFDEMLEKVAHRLEKFYVISKKTDDINITDYDGPNNIEKASAKGERLSVCLDDKKIVVEANPNSNSHEIFIGLEDKEGYWLQDLVVVRQAYNDKPEKQDAFTVLVYADSESEDYTHNFTINSYEETESE